MLLGGAVRLHRVRYLCVIRNRDRFDPRISVIITTPTVLRWIHIEHASRPMAVRDEGFAASKLSYLETFLRDGGGVWLGASSTEPQDTIKVTQCGGNHGRTFAIGCNMSAKPNGE